MPISFEDLKEYLIVPPLVVSPKSSKILYLYLTASDETLAVISIRKTPKGQFLIYYISKALHSSKFNYKRIKKLAYALLMAS